MARRWQIMKRTELGVFRATVNTVEGMEEIVRIAQTDPECQWIVVKDRVLNRRHQIWRRSKGVVVEPWWREDDGVEAQIISGAKPPQSGED